MYMRCGFLGNTAMNSYDSVPRGSQSHGRIERRSTKAVLSLSIGHVSSTVLCGCARKVEATLEIKMLLLSVTFIPNPPAALKR